MKIQVINSLPDPALAKAIDSFEQQFSYPLGTKTRFRISHGNNYCRFYQAMGESQSLLAEDNGIVYGAIATALRTIQTPQGGKIIAAYVGDFKIVEQAQGTRAAYRLLKETQNWILARTDYAFCIVMNGTSSSPLDYTGRLSIAKFRHLDEVSILRITIHDHLPEKSLPIAKEREASSLHKNLVRTNWSMLTTEPTMRSTMNPQWLINHHRSACGRIEDTRKAKRLFTLNNQEILTAHLSNFAYLTPAAGAEIIFLSLAQAAQHGYTSIFVAINPEHVSTFRELLAPHEISEARASIFGNLPTDAVKTSHWSVNTCEI